MRVRIRPALAAAALLALPLLVTGCGGATKVSGKITNGGKPLALSDKGVIVMSLTSEEDKKVYAVDTKPDGTFTVVGDGHGCPPGKYKIAIQAYDPYPTTDTLEGKFAPGKTPIVKDVTGSALDIDISKPEG